MVDVAIRGGVWLGWALRPVALRVSRTSLKASALDPTNAAVSNVRFYLPALGPIAQIGAWLHTRIPSRARRPAATAALCIAVVFGLGVWSLHVMYAGLGIRLHGM